MLNSQPFLVIYSSFQGLFCNGVTIKTLILLRKKTIYVPSFELEDSLFEMGAWLITDRRLVRMSVIPTFIAKLSLYLSKWHKVWETTLIRPRNSFCKLLDARC